MAKIKLMLIDRFPIVRTGIQKILPSRRFEVIAEADHFKEGLRLAQRVSPEIIVTELGAVVAEGIHSIRNFRRKCPESRILVFSRSDRKKDMLDSALAGAHGYISKRADPTELIRGLEAVFSGATYFGGRVARVLARGNNHKSVISDRPTLSTRELEVLVLIAEGMTSKVIAERLSLSSRTIETHRERIMQKLGINSIAGLTRYAIRQGHVELE